MNCSIARMYYKIGEWTKFGWDDNRHDKTIDRRIARRRLSRELKREINGGDQI